MAGSNADALVIFGAGGDLSLKMLYPALYALELKGALDIPVLGVARAHVDRAQLLGRIATSIAAYRPVDGTVFDALAGRLDYIAGDIGEASTFDELRRRLDGARRPLFYLALPPALFAPTARALSRAGLTAGARLAVEKPFGYDLASARELDAELRAVFDEESIFRIDHFLALPSLHELFYFRSANAAVAPLWNRHHVKAVQITMAEAFGVGTRGRFFEEVGALRDVLQNHLAQVLAMVAMEPTGTDDPEAWHESRKKLLQSVRPLTADDAVRGQYTGYREIEGVAADSDVETFIAVRMAIDSVRWKGVPFYLRAGKCLPLTATEVYVELASRPEQTAEAVPSALDHWRFRLGPGSLETALGVSMGERDMGVAPTTVELEARHGRADDRDAYERVLADVLAGNRAWFERMPAIEAQWRIVDALLRDRRPAEQYDPGTWGPSGAARLLGRMERWHNPAPVA